MTVPAASSPERRRGSRSATPITAEAIVDTAFALIDHGGQDAFSMRSVAAELGVFPATLYWHVGDRAKLLGLVELQWVNGIELPAASDDWREWMLELARRYRAHARRHPHVARLVTLERARNVDSLAIPDAIVGVLATLGLGDDIVHAYNALMGAVRGFVLLELSMAVRPPLPAEADDVEQDLRGIDEATLPNIAAHFPLFADRALSMRWSEESTDSLDDSFEYLLDLLLDGLAGRMPKRSDP